VISELGTDEPDSPRGRKSGKRPRGGNKQRVTEKKNSPRQDGKKWRIVYLKKGRKRRGGHKDELLIVYLSSSDRGEKDKNKIKERLGEEIRRVK